MQSEGPNPSRAAQNTEFEREDQPWDVELGEDMAMVREMIALALSHCG
jgi:hypothetical protein